MKRFLLLLAALAAWAGGAAQDVILLRSSDEVKAVVTEITDSHLLYKVWGGSDVVFSIPRAEVFSVTYQNDEKEFFMQDQTVGKAAVTVDYPWPVVTQNYRPGDLFDEDGLRGLVISTTDEGRHGLILSLDQSKRLPWVGEENEMALAGTVEAAPGWTTVQYNYHGGVALGLTDRMDGWNNRQRLIEVMVSTGLDWSDFPAFEWCEAKGGGWYLPAVEELLNLWLLLGGVEVVDKIGYGDVSRMRSQFNVYMERYGGDKYPAYYWMWLWSSTEKSLTASFYCDLGCPPNARVSYFKCTYEKMRNRGAGKAVSWPVRAVHKF